MSVKKTIHFTDLDGGPLVETFEFNLNASELAEMELTTEGGFAARLEKIAKTNQGKAVWEMFDRLLSTAFGVRSEDNKRFIKSKKLWKQFKQTKAYDVLIMEMLTEPEAASVFLISMIPADLVEKVRKGEKIELPDAVQDTPTEKKIEEYSRAELLSMDAEQFDKLAGTDPSKMSKSVLQIAFQRKSSGR